MIPSYVKKYLWYLDIKKLDLKKDKFSIILNVLDNGNQKAIDWLFKTYKTSDIKSNILKNKILQRLNKKSSNFWKIVLDLK